MEVTKITICQEFLLPQFRILYGNCTGQFTFRKDVITFERDFPTRKQAIPAPELFGILHSSPRRSKLLCTPRASTPI